MTDTPDALELEHRLQRIERRLGLGGFGDGKPSLPHPAWACALGLAALVPGFLGLGFPQHYYQVLFGGLLTLFLYHRGFLIPARGYWKWPQTAVNFLLLCLLFKLLIGGGVAHPFDWFKLPAIAKNPSSGEPSWYSLPDYTVQWHAVPTLAEWSIDVTRIQTLLFVVVFAGALFRFEPFTSAAALVMLVVSLPSYLRYDWNQVILFLVAGSISIYLQARAFGRTSFP